MLPNGIGRVCPPPSTLTRPTVERVQGLVRLRLVISAADLKLDIERFQHE